MAQAQCKEILQNERVQPSRLQRAREYRTEWMNIIHFKANIWVILEPKEEKEDSYQREGKAGESQSGLGTSWQHMRSQNRVSTILPSRTAIIMAGGLLGVNKDTGGQRQWPRGSPQDGETLQSQLHSCTSTKLPALGDSRLEVPDLPRSHTHGLWSWDSNLVRRLCS